MRQLPNALSIVRLFLVPVFAILLFHGQEAAAGAVFGAAALTDQADGWLARRLKAETRFGLLADPLADKVAIATALVSLIVLHRLPWWTFVPLVVRQLVLWGLRVATRGRVSFPVSGLARASAWFLYVGLGLAIVLPAGTAAPVAVYWIGAALAVAEIGPYIGHIQRASSRTAVAPSTAAFPGSIVAIGGQRVAYCVAGPADGTPIVLFHGWGECRLTRPTDRSVLDELRIRLVTIDRPGLGGSDPQPGRVLLDWPRVVAAVADDLGLDRFAVIGRSAGAAYAAVAAAGLPDRVAGVTLVSGIGPPSPGAWRLLAASDFRKLIFWLRVLPFLARPTLWAGVRLVRPWIPRLLDRHVAGLPETDRAVLADPVVHEMRVHSLQEAFRHGEEGIYEDAVLLTRDWGFDLASITQPVRLWHGLDDTIVHPGFSRWIAERIPHSRPVYVPGSGHYLLYTHWTDILRAAADDFAYAGLSPPAPHGA
jgi:CDP-diacylglycerol--glycerol-3-phosphate 3-phosphatidyltransferase